MNNEKIYEIYANFILKNYKFAYSIEFDGNYENIVNYWNKWFIENEYEGLTKKLLSSIVKYENINKSYIEELNTIFRAHYNSSDNHMIIFYISHSKKILVKIKAPNIKNENNIPFWTITISNENILKQMQMKNIVKGQLSVLVYN